MSAFFLALSLAWATGVPELTLHGSVDPGTAAYIIDAIEAAEAAGAPAVLLRVDTPGGLLTSTREIVQAELAANVPVIVFVEPAGAHAGSAGVFLTLAAHVAAMAPGTTIGAAHPVGLGGESDEDGVMEEKVLQDTSAWARAIAARRGRPADWAESAVRESVAVTDAEALKLGVIDLVARDVDALFEALEGRVVETPTGPVTLHLAGLVREPVAMTIPQRVAHALGNPDVLFLALALGALGLWIEMQSPGLILPGTLGVILLLAAAVGLSILPFNAAGLVLLLFGFGLCAAEVWGGGHGLFAISGGAAIVLGGLLLFDVSGFDLRVDPRLLGFTGLLIGIVAIGVAWSVTRAHRRKVVTGAEGLVGELAQVWVGGDGEGRVRVAGEDWHAVWAGHLDPGARVRVRKVEGLTVEVEATT